MRQALASVILVCAVATPVLAHPGVGIVVDSRGNIYYTDLQHVWRQAPDGSTEIVVRGVHTHELYLDRADTLYGEHLWYDAGVWRNRIWRRTPDGRVQDVIPARSGFVDDYDDFHFVRDTSGAMYWVDQETGGAPSRLRYRLGAGPARTIAAVPSGHVGWLGVSRSGTVYFVAGGHLYRAVEGRAQVLARDISEHSTVPWHVRAAGWVLRVLRLHDGPDHDVGGVWLDNNENVYVAVPGGGVVKRITPRGQVQVIHRGVDDWTAVGGTMSTGALLLLEVGPAGRVRVRRVALQ